MSAAKLFDKQTALQDPAERVELVNLILDVLPEFDSNAQQDFTDQLLAAIYFGLMVPHTSLFFYRCKHLE